MYIRDEDLRKAVKEILNTKNTFTIVNEINQSGDKLNSKSFTSFLNGKQVTLNTLKAIDKYVIKNTDDLPY